MERWSGLRVGGVVIAVLLWLGALSRAGAQGVGNAADAVFPPPQPPLRVMTLRGLWYPLYGVERALARSGGALIGESWHAPAPHLRPKETLRLFPASLPELMRYHVLVICNVNGDSIPAETKRMIVEYVKQGGSILFLGGYYAYGAEYQKSEFAPLLPADAAQFEKAPENMTLSPGKDAIGAGFAGLNWAAKPRVFWYHRLAPKPEAKVLLTAGGQPLLVCGTYGNGRVALFGGTVMGVPKEGELPFWQWEDWPAVLAETLRWLGTRPPDAAAGVPADLRKQWTATLLGPGIKKAGALTPLLKRASACCGDTETAHLLLDAVGALDEDPPLDVIEQIDARTWPYLTAESATHARRLLQSAKPGAISLGLRALGRCKAAEARALLEEAMQTGEVAGEDGGPGDDLQPSMTADPDTERHLIRLGAIEGLGSLGDPAALPALKQLIRRTAPKRSKPEDMPNELTRDDELYDEAVWTALRCGDESMADRAVDLLLEHQYVTIRMLAVINLPHYGARLPETWNLIARLSKVFPRHYARCEGLPWRLVGLPPRVLPALARRMAREEEAQVIPLALAAFGSQFRRPGETLPAEVLDILRTAKLPAVADLARQAPGR